MGNYIPDMAALEVRMGADVITNLARSAGAARTTLVDAVIGRAEGIVDGYAGIKWEVPLPTTPFIQDIAMAIAEYEMYKRGQGNDVPIKYKTSYDEAMETLVLIQKGEIKPPGGSIAVGGSGVGGFDLSSDDPVFNYDNMGL